jgi:hypothetical protein
MKIKEIEAYWRFWFSKVPAHYPDPGNPGHYMNVFKTPTTLNDGQQA